ncbi:MAG: DUF378 domain-containing protein [Patescibacteria group bacterium]
MITWILVVVGALNWGLSAIGYNVVEMLLGGWPTILQAVYILVGLSAIVEIATHKKTCRMCNSSSAMM